MWMLRNLIILFSEFNVLAGGPLSDGNVSQLCRNSSSV